MKWFKLHNEVSKGWRRLHILISILLAIIGGWVLGWDLHYESYEVTTLMILTPFIYYIILLTIVWVIRGFKESDS